MVNKVSFKDKYIAQVSNTRTDDEHEINHTFTAQILFQFLSSQVSPILKSNNHLLRKSGCINMVILGNSQI